MKDSHFICPSGDFLCPYFDTRTNNCKMYPRLDPREECPDAYSDNRNNKKNTNMSRKVILRYFPDYKRSISPEDLKEKVIEIPNQFDELLKHPHCYGNDDDIFENFMEWMQNNSGVEDWVCWESIIVFDTNEYIWEY